MLKFMSGIVIVAFTTFCGYYLAKKYRQRKLFFTQFKEFNERFLNEIAYRRRPLVEFAQNYPYQGEFNEFLQDFFLHINENQPFLDFERYTFLKEEEKSVLKDYFAMLGKGDSASQKAYFSSLKDPLSKFQTEAETTCKRYGDLYIKIGFLCGLLILILII